MKPAVFIDRDGVLNHNDKSKPGGPKYVLSWADWEWIDGAIEGVKLLADTQYKLIVVSNQMCVGLGLVSYGKMRAIFNKMGSQLHRSLFQERMNKSTLDMACYFCPHHWQDNCACRKPKPGLIFHAAVEHGIDLHKSWMIGDGESDMKAGWNAGIRKLIRITDAEPPRQLKFNSAGGYPSGSLLDAANLIISHVGGKS